MITDDGAATVPRSPQRVSRAGDRWSPSPGGPLPLHQIPRGTYTQNNAAPAFLYKTVYDGVTLTSGTSVIYVDTYRFSEATTSCFPTDGGFPDFSAGGFNGVLDNAQVDDGTIHKVLFFGSCSDLGS